MSKKHSRDPFAILDEIQKAMRKKPATPLTKEQRREKQRERKERARREQEELNAMIAPLLAKSRKRRLAKDASGSPAKKRRVLSHENDERGSSDAFIKPLPKLRTVSASEGKNLPRSLPRDGKRYEKVIVRHSKPKKRKKTPILSSKEGKGLPKTRPAEGKWQKVKVTKTRKVSRVVEIKIPRPPKLNMKPPHKDNVQQHLMAYFSDYMKKLEKKYAKHQYLLPCFRAWLIDDTSKNIIEACKDEMKSPVEIKKPQANGVQEYAKAVLQLLHKKYLAEQEKKIQSIPAAVENHIASLTPQPQEFKLDEKLSALPEELKARIQKAKEHLSTKEMEEFELQERLLQEKKQPQKEQPYLPKNLLFPAAKLKTKLYDLSCLNDIVKQSLEAKITDTSTFLKSL